MKLFQAATLLWAVSELWRAIIGLWRSPNTPVASTDQCRLGSSLGNAFPGCSRRIEALRNASTYSEFHDAKDRIKLRRCALGRRAINANTLTTRCRLQTTPIFPNPSTCRLYCLKDLQVNCQEFRHDILTALLVQEFCGDSTNDVLVLTERLEFWELAIIATAGTLEMLDAANSKLLQKGRGLVCAAASNNL